jgi:two-component system nitrate/nitrite response regulator NarP
MMIKMSSRAKPYTILIVDDAPIVREALRWAFENQVELRVIGEASDGPQAIAQATALSPDIVILDIELPLLDGYSVAQTLKALPQPPLIVFLTVHTDALSKQRCSELGADGFVEKGEGWTALLAEIQSLVIDC